MELRLRRVMLFAKDMKAMTRFYEEQLGFKVLERSDDFVDLDAGACRIALHRTAKPNPGRTKICLYARDVSAARRQLIARGVKMGDEPGPGSGLRLCDARDPEGNRIQISNRP